jgi:methyltransferase (TIGR00027 family)
MDTVVYRVATEVDVRDGVSSKTAEQNALFRAIETRRSTAAEPIHDPQASRFLGATFRIVHGIARVPVAHRAVTGFIDRRWPGVRSSVVARTKLIDALVTTAAGEVEQVVLLGAGFDSRPYRLECLRDRRVFEVDHPATQRRKRARLTETESAGVRFAATDFLDGDLDPALAAAGFRPDQTTLFLWEGVTNYLDASAVDATLRWCAGAPSGSQIVFTYIDARVLADPTSFEGATRVLATSRRSGESVTFGMRTDDMGAYLRERGLTLRSDVGAADYRRAYYGAAAERIRGHEFYRVAHAVI